MQNNPNTQQGGLIQTDEAESQKLIKVAKVFDNLDQNIIRITEDKTKLILIEHLKKVEDKKAWIVPLGIFIPLFLIPITTESFKDAFSIPAAVWQAGCYIGIAASCIWLIISICKAYKGKNTTIDYIISELKKKSDDFNETKDKIS